MEFNNATNPGLFNPLPRRTTEEQIAAIIAAAPRAERELEQRISAMRKSGDELDAAFHSSVEQLRGRIRQIDVSVVR